MIYNLFSGSIPASLGNCRSLLRVSFWTNQLFRDVPTEFWSLPRVYHLDLSGNAFSGNISNMISSAKNLSNLQISRNKFSGVIPSEIENLKNLVEFFPSDVASGPISPMGARRSHDDSDHNDNR
ncbi:hypothetical protein T459_16425 [Capsicum annuum]|uniref:Uncharacterized protein n=1 Tax=Capsicum annuum TaxID=4072 RepID=A0A2G2Z8N9_CAPAN|nr:hypothetical protein T459_16425 [Capsicum annuum]